MDYIVVINKVEFEDSRGVPRIGRRETLASFPVKTATAQEIELLYILTHPDEGFTQFMEKTQEDGYYQLSFLKQSIGAKMVGLPPDKFFGWALIQKNKDHIHWETKYMNIGNLNKYNLKRRDPQEEVRRSNWYKVPGTLEKKEDKVLQDVDSYKGKVISG